MDVEIINGDFVGKKGKILRTIKMSKTQEVYVVEIGEGRTTILSPGYVKLVDKS